MLIETFIRKQLGLKAHTVTKVEEGEGEMIIHIDRLGKRLLRCGLCRQRCRKVHSGVEVALPPTAGGMPPVWRTGGGLSLGGAVGAGHLGSVPCGRNWLGN